MKLSPKMLAVLVFLGGLVVIGYQVYELNEVRLGIRDLRPAKIPEPALPDPSAQQEQLKASLSSLRQQHLMGNPQAKETPAPDTQKVVDTNLKLELVGTIRGSLGDRDSALIQAKGKETKRYYVGDEIEGGARLDTVNEDTVILKRGAALETLRYSKSESNSVADAPAPATQNKQRPRPAQKEPDASSEASEQEQTNVENGNEAVSTKPKTLRERLKGGNRPLTPTRPEPK